MHPYLSTWQYGYTLGPSSDVTKGQYTVYNQQASKEGDDSTTLKSKDATAHSLSGPQGIISSSSSSSTNNVNIEIHGSSPKSSLQPKHFVRASNVAQVATSSSQLEPGECTSTMGRLESLANHLGLVCQFAVSEKTSSSFVVSLKLGNEQYLGRGSTELNAKSNAALQALSNTSYVFKTTMKPRPSNCTPTSQLYEMAAKSKANVQFNFLWPENFKMDQNMKNWSKQEMRAYYRVQLTVGEGSDSKSFVADSDLPQQAKHNASIMAIPYVRTLMNDKKKKEEEKESNKEDDDNNEEEANKAVNTGDKNPIMLINELAQARSLPLEWKFDSDTGPAHMREYKWSVRLGSYQSSGSGSSKKLARANAAVALLETLPDGMKTLGKKSSKKRKRALTSHHGDYNSDIDKEDISKNNNNSIIGPQIIPASVSGSNAFTSKSVLDGQLVYKVITATNPISALFEYARKAKVAEPDFVCVSESVLETWQRDSKTFKKMDYTMKLDIGSKTYFANANTKKAAKAKVAEEAWNVIRASKF